MYRCFSLPNDEPVVSRAAPRDASHRARPDAGDRRKAARSVALRFPSGRRYGLVMLRQQGGRVTDIAGNGKQPVAALP